MLYFQIVFYFAGILQDETVSPKSLEIIIYHRYRGCRAFLLSSDNDHALLWAIFCLLSSGHSVSPDVAVVLFVAAVLQPSAHGRSHFLGAKHMTRDMENVVKRVFKHRFFFMMIGAPISAQNPEVRSLDFVRYFLTPASICLVLVVSNGTVSSANCSTCDDVAAVPVRSPSFLNGISLPLVSAEAAAVASVVMAAPPLPGIRPAATADPATRS